MTMHRQHRLQPGPNKRACPSKDLPATHRLAKLNFL